jgi:23S rRNA (adenine2503-C2)-methyltransferase
MPPAVDLAGLERTEIEHAFEGLGIRAYHGRQVFSWIHARGVSDFAAMTDLALPLRKQLAESLTISSLALDAEATSIDGTRKFLIALADSRRIESVYIPDTPAQTFCVSTQVGCAMACAFCLTGKMGLVRNLTAAEIVGQVRLLAHRTGLAGSAFNIVLMGMGEPLHNYDATLKALRILANPKGMAVHPKRVTLSTVGLVPALERLAREEVMPNVAISLHATTDDSRNVLVPLNKRYDLEALVDACRKIPVGRRARITFEYVLLAGVNDTPADARRLATLVGGLKAKVNLLPLNEAPGIPFARPTDERVSQFAGILAEKGVRVSVRKSRGRDIRAACGQLIVEGAKDSPAQRLASRIEKVARTRGQAGA